MRRPRLALALAGLVTGAGVFSSSVGIGALPTSTLPVYGVTSGEGSRATVAELGDVNGDHIDDYAVGMPSSDAGGTDSGIVYVFLGKAGAATPTATSLNLASASFRITGHGGEMLGYALAGGDLNGDGRADIAIGAPMAGAPAKSNGGAVYIVYGQTSPTDLSTTTLSTAGYTNDPTAPATQSPLGSRYDGFQVDSHTGMTLAVTPDVNVRNGNAGSDGAGLNDLIIGMPDAALHRPGGGGVAVLYGKRTSVHINLSDLWEAGYPYYFHIDYPALDNQHVGESVAAVGDVTGDGVPDVALGAPQADPGGRVDAGSVWIISGDLPEIEPAAASRQSTPRARGSSSTRSARHRPTGSTARPRATGSAARSPTWATRTATASRTSRSAPPPPPRAGARARARPSSSRAATASPHVDLATSPPLERIDGAMAGAGLGASLAAAGDVDGDGHDRPPGGRARRVLVQRRRLPRARRAEHRQRPRPGAGQAPGGEAAARSSAAPSRAGSRSTATASTA